MKKTLTLILLILSINSLSAIESVDMRTRYTIRTKPGEMYYMQAGTQFGSFELISETKQSSIALGLSDKDTDTERIDIPFFSNYQLFYGTPIVERFEFNIYYDYQSEIEGDVLTFYENSTLGAGLLTSITDWFGCIIAYAKTNVEDEEINSTEYGATFDVANIVNMSISGIHREHEDFDDDEKDGTSIAIGKEIGIGELYVGGKAAHVSYSETNGQIYTVYGKHKYFPVLLSISHTIFNYPEEKYSTTFVNPLPPPPIIDYTVESKRYDTLTLFGISILLPFETRDEKEEPEEVDYEPLETIEHTTPSEPQKYYNEAGYYHDISIYIDDNGNKVVSAWVGTNRDFFKSSIQYKGKVYPLAKTGNGFSGNVKLGKKVPNPAVINVYLKEHDGTLHKEKLTIYY
ncbi:hypothetical protein ACFL56_01480 [Candidatus Margulisiibacteriota bacterium]